MNNNLLRGTVDSYTLCLYIYIAASFYSCTVYFSHINFICTIAGGEIIICHTIACKRSACLPRNIISDVIRIIYPVTPSYTLAKRLSYPPSKLYAIPYSMYIVGGRTFIPSSDNA